MPHHLGLSRPSADDRLTDTAWHLLAALLRIRRPASPTELAVYCGPAASPALVAFLCRIPYSPLRLGADGLVTVSSTAAAAFAAFLLNGIPRFAPQPCSVEVPGWGRGYGFPWGVAGRKRKGDVLSVVAKRRPVLPVLGDCRKLATDETIPSISGSGDLVGVADEGVEFNISTAHITKFSNFSDESLKQNGLSISSNDQANNALVDMDPDGNGKGGDVDMKSAHQGYPFVNRLLHKLDDLHEQKIQQYSPHVDEMNMKPAEFKVVTAEEVFLSVTETVLDVSVGRPDEHTQHICAVNEKIIQKDLIGFSLGAQGEVNGLNVAGSISSHVAEAGFSVDNRSGTGINLDGKDMCNAGDAVLHVNVHVLRSGINASAQVDKVQRVAKREATSGSLVLKKLAIGKSSIKNKASGNAAKSRTGTLDTYQNNLENTCIQIEKKYVRRKFRSQNQDVQEKVVESSPVATIDTTGTKGFPQFDNFVVEDEEGSGGYGIVYKASRKNDGKTFAIKCPHSNANAFHVNNELKMLERFGGRSFIIRLEGSFKSGKSECFVLEHVEHDRPEVLKREIEVSELQWYCYCLFKALSCLHKQGVVHRDVKPGNFLFSRKVNKGYLIDFNLALDLHHKHRLNNQHDSDLKGSPAVSSPVALPTGSRKPLNDTDAFSIERNKESRRSTLLNSNKKGTEKGSLDVFSDFSGRHKSKNQVTADGSGLTSVKDATSGRTPSAERMRQPLPACSRKELRSILQEVMQTPKLKAPSPVTQRKRIPAPLGKMERLLALLTPMPVQLNGGPVSGSGQLKKKGATKEKMEGPCVGTKGFRAPEVLFRSRHQGYKIDMWSAGVTILYLITSRMPFSGDPEHNIKEIAKLKGSEDLWEVAKIHDRESSFPTELYDIQSLQPVRLRDWCRMNTKRQEFLDELPDTLFDLLDRCLAVNPRTRISSEEALMHDFLSPCRDELKRQRIVRLAREL